jgi:AcrR family transcriptional regulator
VSTTEKTHAVRQLRADARRNRQRILDAAIEVFSEQGVEAQIDDVARRADLGVGTIYRHFPTKEALVSELVRRKFRQFAANAREALTLHGDPFEILADTLRANAELCARDASLQQALTGAGEAAWTHTQAEIDELRGLIGELMGRAQEAGTMRRDIGVDDIPMLMCGVSATMTHTAPGFDWHRHLDLVIAMLRGPAHGVETAQRAGTERLG